MNRKNITSKQGICYTNIYANTGLEITPFTLGNDYGLITKFHTKHVFLLSTFYFLLKNIPLKNDQLRNSRPLLPPV